MAQKRHLPNAPITEAVIDLRVELSAPATVEDIRRALADRRNLGYTIKGPIVQSEFGFSVNIEEEPQIRARASSATTLGLRLHSADDRYVAQFSIAGFTLSRLQPYESWENLLSEAKRLWAGYLECLPVERIVRTATRYINNLRLPLTQNLERFLILLPVLPDGVPELLSAFLQRFVVHHSASGSHVILTQTLEATSPEGPLPVILDIDAFRETVFAPAGPQVWQGLDQLRSLKNDVFFGCLTEEAIGLYL
jgi:uncharacterized protein (TIGR04255 family)